MDDARARQPVSAPLTGGAVGDAAVVDGRRRGTRSTAAGIPAEDGG